MAQTFADDLYNFINTVDTDMGNIELALYTLKSLFSGATQPASTNAGMPWYDTNKNILKVRNAANSQWYGVMHGDLNQKIWVYRNSAMEGWELDGSVTDKVIALKGGINDYNVSGGTVSGSWTQPDHTLTINEIPEHRHLEGASVRYGNGSKIASGTVRPNGSDATYSYNYYTSYQGSSESHNHGTVYRPYAAVGTLQAPKV